MSDAALIVAGKNLRQHWADQALYLKMDAQTMAMNAAEMRKRDTEVKREFLAALKIAEQNAAPLTPDQFDIRVKGYMPCRIVSKTADRYGTVMVAFEDNTRRRFQRYKVKGAENL